MIPGYLAVFESGSYHVRSLNGTSVYRSPQIRLLNLNKSSDIKLQETNQLQITKNCHMLDTYSPLFVGPILSAVRIEHMTKTFLFNAVLQTLRDLSKLNQETWSKRN